MRAVEEGKLANTSTAFERHIDRCLGCRACEAVCPAGVEYGQLLEAARAELTSAGVKGGAVYALLRFMLRHVWLKPKRLSKAFTFARFLRDKGIARFLVKTKVARAISSQFEFALMLLEASSGYRTVSVSERLLNADRMPANRPQDASAPNANELLDAGAPNDRERITLTVDEESTGTQTALLFKGCVTDGLFRRVND